VIEIFTSAATVFKVINPIEGPSTVTILENSNEDDRDTRLSPAELFETKIICITTPVIHTAHTLLAIILD
jgi:hypothetical protein